MKRALPAFAAVLGALALLAVFWLMAPSVDAPVPDADGAAPGKPAPLSLGQGARRSGEERDGPGPPDGVETDDEEPDVLAEARATRQPGIRGGLPRMRRVVEQLEAIEGEPIPAGLSEAEEDALIAKPIADKAKLLTELEIDARVIRSGEDPLMAARADLFLARGYSNMADFLEDRPVPSYLSDEAANDWLLQLEKNADAQREKAAEAKQRAKESAADAELPEDHPLLQRLE